MLHSAHWMIINLKRTKRVSRVRRAKHVVVSNGWLDDSHVRYNVPVLWTSLQAFAWLRSSQYTIPHIGSRNQHHYSRFSSVPYVRKVSVIDDWIQNDNQPLQSSTHKVHLTYGIRVHLWVLKKFFKHRSWHYSPARYRSTSVGISSKTEVPEHHW